MAGGQLVLVEASCSYSHCQIAHAFTKKQHAHLAVLPQLSKADWTKIHRSWRSGAGWRPSKLTRQMSVGCEKKDPPALRRTCRAQAAQTSESWPLDEEYQVSKVASLDEFFEVNSGNWTGTFMQFNARGSVLESIPTKMTAVSYGKGEDAGLLQRLSVKQAAPKTRVEGDEEGPMWKDYKFDEINSSTVGNRQQLSYFPGKGAFSLSHQTSEMLSMVIRTGVLGEDDDEEDEAPRGEKLPSRRPALVTESCLYSSAMDRRMRAVHVLDAQGSVDMFGVFREARDTDIQAHHRAWAEGSQADDDDNDEPEARVEALLGEWRGQSVTRRTVLYGSTVSRETPVVVTYRRGEDPCTVVQEINQGGIRIISTAVVDGALLQFDKGFHTTLLPGGMSVSYPTLVSSNASFYFEAAWMESPTVRQRLIRTYDVSGQVVSATLSTETKA